MHRQHHASMHVPVKQSQVQQKKASEDDVDTHIQNRYELDRRLGKGAYGVVYRALDHLTGNVVAVKKIYDAFRNGTDAQRTLREISFLCIFSGHPNIVHLINVHEAANPRDLYLIFEYVSYDLDSLIKRRKFKLREKQFILYQIFNGIAFMHSAGVMHRDLKPSNILVDDAFEVKLCDLGLARAVSDRIRAGCETPQGQGLTDYVATRWYRAPEILLGSNRYTKSVDMWSIGCILAEMLTQEPMFQGRTAFHQLDLILSIVPHPTREDLRHLESHLRINAIENTMGRVRRRTWAEVIPDSTPEEREMLSCLLQFSYRKRLTAVEALQHPYLGPFRNSHEIQLLSRKSTICQMVDKRHALLRDGNLLQPENYRKIIMEMIKSFPQCGIPRRTSSFMSESVSRLSLMSRVSSSPTRVGLDILERSGMDTRPKASHPSTSIFAHKATSFQATTDNVLGRSESYHCSRQQSIASVHELNRFRRPVPESQHLTHGRMDRASKASNLALNRNTANARPMYIRREVSSPSCSSNSFQKPIGSQILNYSRYGGSSSYESLSEHNSGRNARLRKRTYLETHQQQEKEGKATHKHASKEGNGSRVLHRYRAPLEDPPTGRQHPSGQAGIFESTKSSLNLPKSFPLFTRCPPGFKLKAAVSPASSFQNPKTAATSSMATVPSTAHRSKPTRSTTNTVVAVIGRAGLTSAKRGPAKSPVKRIVIPIDNRRQTNVQRRALEFESKNTHARQFRIKQSPKYRCVSPTWRTNEPEEIILAPARSEHCVIDVGNEEKNPLKVSRIRRRGGRDDNRHLERQEDDDNDSLLVTATLSALSLAATASGVFSSLRCKLLRRK